MSKIKAKRTIQDYYNRGRTLSAHLAPLKVTPAMKARIVNVAAREGMSEAEWRRQAIEAALASYHR